MTLTRLLSALTLLAATAALAACGGTSSASGNGKLSLVAYSTPKEGYAYLTQLFHHVPVQDKSARDAMQTFTSGKGDVLLAYENEAIAAKQAGQGVDYVIPDQTILIQNPIAVTKTSGNAAAAKRFI